MARRLQHKDAERFIGVEWADEPVRAFETGVLVTVANGKGTLARVAAALANAEADIVHVDMQSLGRDFGDTEPWIDLSQYPQNWPELQRRHVAA